jgi:hypothetical protein
MGRFFSVQGTVYDTVCLAVQASFANWVLKINYIMTRFEFIARGHH